MTDPFGPPPTGPPLVGVPAPTSQPPPSSPPPSFSPPGAPPPPPAPTQPAGGFMPYEPQAPAADGVRPWWGMGDLALALPFVIVLSAIGTMLGIAFTDLDTLGDRIEADDIPSAMFAMGLIGQQVGQGAWPLIVSKWKGLGPASDWRLRFKPADLWIGPTAGLLILAAAGAIGWLATELVGLEDSDQADNTAFLTDAEGTVWYWVLIVVIVIGAPLSEELLFRGLALRSIEKRHGLVAGVVGSTVLFTLPHFIGTGWQGTVVLFAAIGVAGAGMGLLTAKTDRLGPAILAHLVFNGVGVLGATGVVEESSAMAFVIFV